MVGVLVSTALPPSVTQTRVRLVLYGCMGWVGLVPAVLLYPCLAPGGWRLLALGGAGFSLGIALYVHDRASAARAPLHDLRVWWYILVVLACGAHYAAVYVHATPPSGPCLAAAAARGLLSGDGLDAALAAAAATSVRGVASAGAGGSVIGGALGAALEQAAAAAAAAIAAGAWHMQPHQHQQQHYDGSSGGAHSRPPPHLHSSRTLLQGGAEFLSAAVGNPSAYDNSGGGGAPSTTAATAAAAAVREQVTSVLGRTDALQRALLATATELAHTAVGAAEGGRRALVGSTARALRQLAASLEADGGGGHGGAGDEPAAAAAAPVQQAL